VNKDDYIYRYVILCTAMDLLVVFALLYLCLRCCVFVFCVATDFFSVNNDLYKGVYSKCISRGQHRIDVVTTTQTDPPMGSTGPGRG